MMDYRYLGRSALKVSPLCLGTMMFGGQTPDAEAARIIDKARARGVNFIDTADVYNEGRSEAVVGRNIAADRDYWVLATKFVNAPRDGRKGPNLGGYSRKWVIEAVEGSLRRLGTDYIDILYLHRAVFDAPASEVMRAIADLIRGGKLRYFGVSNFRGWRIAEIAHLADEFGIDRPIASQPLYNMVSRTAEVEEMPAAAHFGLGIVPYSGLRLKAAYAAFDAERRFDLEDVPGHDNPACECGAILRGVKKPVDCKLFGTVCTPETPMGSCMVSSEGACAAHWTYGRFRDRQLRRVS